jgi:hypothetical protein
VRAAAEADEGGERALLVRVRGHVLLERLADDVCRRTALAPRDALQFSQKSGVEQD